MVMIIGNPIPTKGMNKGAYRGKLTCPAMGCSSEAVRYVENVTPFRRRYRCRKCGKTFQYEIGADFIHPYAPFKRNKWQRIVQFATGRTK